MVIIITGLRGIEGDVWGGVGWGGGGGGVGWGWGGEKRGWDDIQAVAACSEN